MKIGSKPKFLRSGPSFVKFLAYLLSIVNAKDRVVKCNIYPLGIIPPDSPLGKCGVVLLHY